MSTQPTPTEAPAAPTLDVAAVLGRTLRALNAIWVLIDTLFPKIGKTPISARDIILYLQRTQRRFEHLLVRLAAGIAPRKRAPRPKSATPKPRKNPRFRLPRRKDWLGGLLVWHARGYAAEIASALDHPGTGALIAASPQAQRLLRPLCHMFGLTPACIPPLPKRPRKPRPKPTPKPRRLTRKQREAILWYPNSEGKPMKLLPRRLPRD